MDTPSTVIFGLGLEVGSALAQRFRESGHKVLVADASEKRVEAARTALGEDIEVVHANLGRMSSIESLFVMAAESAGRLQNLVIVPRIPAPDRLMERDLDDPARNPLDILNSCMLGIQLFTKRLMEQDDVFEARADQARQRGTITLVLSNTASVAVPGQFSTQVVQGAARSLMRASALELAELNIRVNAVEALRPRTERERWLDARTPLGRPALADEIADAAIFLASQKAAIITGETLVLDGGRSLLSGLLRAVPESDLNGKKSD